MERDQTKSVTHKSSDGAFHLPAYVSAAFPGEEARCKKKRERSREGKKCETNENPKEGNFFIILGKDKSGKPRRGRLWSRLVGKIRKRKKVRELRMMALPKSMQKNRHARLTDLRARELANKRMEGAIDFRI